MAKIVVSVAPLYLVELILFSHGILHGFGVHINLHDPGSRHRGSPFHLLRKNSSMQRSEPQIPRRVQAVFSFYQPWRTKANDCNNAIPICL